MVKKKKTEQATTNNSERARWKTKNAVLIWRISFVITALNLIAMELMASGFSLSTSIVELSLSKSEYLNQIITILPNMFSFFGSTEAEILKLMSKSIKFVVFFGFFYLCKYFLVQKDPFYPNNLTTKL